MEKQNKENPFEEGQSTKTPEEETVTLTVDGQEITLTMEQLVQAAVSGLSRRAEVIRMAGAAGQVPDGQVYANFIAAYPEVQPGDIPQEVWQDAQMEGSLVSAYRKYEIAQLRASQIDPVVAALRGEM